MSAILVEVLIIGVLLVLNGIFSMSELAIVAAKRVRLEHAAQRGNEGARAALALAANPGEFLSTVQVGITLVGVIASVYGGATIAEQLTLQLQPTWIGEQAEAVALAIVVAAITFLSVILGELVPKRIALGNPERVAALVARPMRRLSQIGSPIVRLLTGSTQLILRLFGVRGVPEPGLTEEEIHAVIEQGAESGVVPEVEHTIVENVFRLGDRGVSAIMTPRADVVWIDAAGTPAALRHVVASGRDWFIVCEGSIEKPRGSVHASQLLAQLMSGRELAVREVMREVLFVPASTPVFRLLTMLQEKKRDIAVVLDEYASVVGVVSRDNVMLALLGHSDAAVTAPVILPVGDGSWTIDGDADIRDVEAELDLQGIAAAQRGYRTLAGFILSRLGHIPTVGEEVEASGMVFQVQALDGRRIDKVCVRKRPG